MNATKFLLLALLMISVEVSATEVTVHGQGVDYDSAFENAQNTAYHDYQDQLVSKIKECSSLKTKVVPEKSNFVMFDLGVNNNKESEGRFEADFIIDIEEVDDLSEKLRQECINQKKDEAAERQDEQEWSDTKKSVSDFGSQFSLGLTAYGLYGYGVGGYFEYRPNALFSVYVNGSYNNLVISQDAPIEGDPSVETASQEAITVGGEVRLLFIFAGYEHIIESTVQSNVIEVVKPTGAFTAGLAIPIGAFIGMNAKSRWKDGATPRAELGIYYKQFNDTIIINGTEESNSYMGGFFVRLRVF